MNPSLKNIKRLLVTPGGLYICQDILDYMQMEPRFQLLIVSCGHTGAAHAMLSLYEL